MTFLFFKSGSASPRSSVIVAVIHSAVEARGEVPQGRELNFLPQIQHLIEAVYTLQETERLANVPSCFSSNRSLDR